VYFALAQSDFPFAPTTFVIRTSASEATVLPALRRTIADAAPGVELASVAPFQQFMKAPLAEPRLNAFLLGVFATSAALVAAIGLGGVVATTVRQRRRELAIRIALGATSRNVQIMILKQALAVVVCGVAAGIGATIATTRALESLLYDVSPTDPGVLIGVAALLVVVAGSAALLPVWRSGKIGAAVALQSNT
jgi:ABC-type antimicrobial peptide transport system permease subunit